MTWNALQPQFLNLCPDGPSTQTSYTYPVAVPRLLIPKHQVPDYWVHEPQTQNPIISSKGLNLGFRLF